MKSLRWLTIGILCLICTSCGSDDEPDVPYTGPWEIEYYEEYSLIHNDSPEFESWFNSHLNDFQVCSFWDGHSVYEYTDYVELDDYKNYHTGEILWIEIVDNASESEIKSLVDKFQQFTIRDSKDLRKYDIFEANYQRYDSK